MRSSYAVAAIAAASLAMLGAPSLGGRAGPIAFALGIAVFPPALVSLAIGARRDRVTSIAIAALWLVLSVGLVGAVTLPTPEPGHVAARDVAVGLFWTLGVLCIVPLTIVASAFARWMRRNPSHERSP